MTNLLVRERFFRIFIGHQLADAGLDGGRRGRATVIGAHVAAKKVFEFKDSAWRGHEFLRGHARNGRFVQAQPVGNLAEHQRAHRQFPFFEKFGLFLDNGLGDALNSFEALLDILDEPARLL